ncbi:hypothetical protein QBC35DRAFT_391553 [Podospora australis]|uniref:Dehydrogenase n=1 Tax=Podospora australis TaxID=1536484 RepID=A0AAN6WQG2_9PEZI|nr:hypothetical protein QBC35DRAFT_391553 [Podospora australis]
MSAPPLVWFITGTTAGIGLALVKHVLSRGDKVIASGRKIEERLASLRVAYPAEQLALLELDIAAGRSVLAAKAAEAWEMFGHVDIVLNNAGISAMCSAEEASEEYVSRMFAVNFHGPLLLTQAFLPFLRAHAEVSSVRPIVAFTSSSTAWTPLPFMTHYAASKAALSAYVEGLRKELKPLGIDAVAFELGGCLTSLGQPREQDFGSLGHKPMGLDKTEGGAYEQGLGELRGMFMADPMGYMPGDVEQVARAMVRVLKREDEETKGWSVRVVLGSDAHGAITRKCEEMLEVLGNWRETAWGTDREGVEGGVKGDFARAVSILEG